MIVKVPGQSNKLGGAKFYILHFINIVFNFRAQPLTTIATLRVLST